MAIEKRNNDKTRRIGDVFSLADRLLQEPFWRSTSSLKREFQAPAMDVSETGDDYLVELEVPGMDPDQLDLSISGQTLTIAGEIKEEDESSDRDYHRIERQYGSFSRQVQLPEATDSENVQANYENGILRVRIPKAEKAKTKKIDVNVS